MLAITGITGHTGNFFLQQLIEHDYDGKLRCMVRPSSNTAPLLACGLDIDVVNGSLTREEDIRSLLNGVDTVVHIANIHYSLDILKIGKECGVRRFILIHTTGVFSKHKQASAGYKAIEAEILPIMKEMNIIILRPSMIFGDMKDHNISKFIRMVDKLPVLPVVAGGHALIQPVNARDLAQAIYKALMDESCNGNAYNVSGERALSLRELYQLIARGLKKKRAIVSFPMWFCLLCAHCLKVITRNRIDIIEKVQRMGENRSFDHSQAVKDFGYEPEPFEIGLSREIEEYILLK